MAIDDNTVYGLTGAQVKELPERINAVKGIARELTADDYNANSSNWSDTDPTNFNCVALWKLPPGMYHKADSTVDVRQSKSFNDTLGNSEIVIVGKSGTYGVILFIITNSGANNGPAYGRTVSVSSGGVKDISHTYGLFKTQDNLTSTYTQAPLSAKQGKVLNDKIGGDLSNLTTTDKTSLINAINELAGGSGGGVTELTSADYNYHRSGDVDDGVALWLLDPGMYHKESGVNVYFSNSGTDISAYDIYVGGMVTPTNMWVAFLGKQNVYVYQINKTTGAGGSPWKYSTAPTITQTTGTSTTDVMSQNATTSMIYADPATCYQVSIGATNDPQLGNNSVRIGRTSVATNTSSVAIGYNATSRGVTQISIGTGSDSGSNECGISIGRNSKAYGKGSIALGAFSGSSTLAQGEMNIGSSNTSYGYNTSNYRLLTGLYDPQSAHDAATKGYVDTAVSGAGGASLTNTEFNTIFGTNLTEGA